MTRRSLTIGLSIALALPLAGASLVAAQEAAPGIGTPVPYTDPEGVTHGTVTIDEVADPFEDFDPERPPEPGTRYVLLTVAFEAAADQTFEPQAYQVIPQDANGFLWTSGFVPRPADVVIPDLQGQPLAPGNRISGVVGYIVPEDAVLDRIWFSPTSDHTVLLADLAPGAGPAPGQPIAYVMEDGSSGAVTVEVTDPFTEYLPDYPPEAGTRFVGLDVAFENVGSAPYEADPYDVMLRDADGMIYTNSFINRPEDAVMPLLEAQTMAPGNRISGFASFIVPADAQITEVLYWPESGRNIVLADLQGGGPAPSISSAPAATPAPVATPEPVVSPTPAATPEPPATPAPGESAGTAR
jgi:hypothetical protein